MDAAPTVLEVATKPVLPTADAPLGIPENRGRAPWGWTALACFLLVISGFVRVWQGRRLEIPSANVGKPPFALKSLSTVLGNWKILNGSERSLDPKVAQVSGCTDHLIRDYFDADTGVVVTLLLGYGPAEWVYGHSPEVCFPAAGFQPVGDALDSEIRWDDGKGTSRFRSGIYDSATGQSSGIRYEAYYSLRHAGRWNPDAVYKTFRKEPAMYRILLQRRVLPSERREQHNPSEQFLTFLLPEIERQIASATQAQAAAAAAAPAAVPASP